MPCATAKAKAKAARGGLASAYFNKASAGEVSPRLKSG